MWNLAHVVNLGLGMLGGLLEPLEYPWITHKYEIPIAVYFCVAGALTVIMIGLQKHAATFASTAGVGLLIGLNIGMILCNEEVIRTVDAEMYVPIGGVFLGVVLAVVAALRMRIGAGLMLASAVFLSLQCVIPQIRFEQKKTWYMVRIGSISVYPVAALIGWACHKYAYWVGGLFSGSLLTVLGLDYFIKSHFNRDTMFFYFALYDPFYSPVFFWMRKSVRFIPLGIGFALPVVALLILIIRNKYKSQKMMMMNNNNNNNMV